MSGRSRAFRERPRPRGRARGALRDSLPHLPRQHDRQRRARRHPVRSLGASVPELQWIVDGYMLAFAALMLTGGTLGDLFGRKKVMLDGVAIFCGGSVMSALATGTSHAHRGPGRDGRRRGGVRAGHALDDPPHLPGAARAREGARRLDRRLGSRARARAGARRRARRLAGDWTWIFWFSVGLGGALLRGRGGDAH